MQDYDPLLAPDPVAWLDLGEQERIALVTHYHELHPPNDDASAGMVTTTDETDCTSADSVA